MIRDPRLPNLHLELPFLFALLLLAGVMSRWIVVFNNVWGIAILAAAMVVISIWLLSFVPRWTLFASVFLSIVIPINLGYSIAGEQGMTITPTRVAFVFLIISLVIDSLRRRRRILQSDFPLAKPFVFYLGVRALGLLNTPDRIGSMILLAGEGGLVTAILAYAAFRLIRNRHQLDRLVTTLLLAGIIVALIGLWEWFTQSYFQATPLVRQFTTTPVIVEEIAFKAQGLPRITSTLAHSLILAGLMAFLLPLAMQRAVLRHGVQRTLHLGVFILLTVALILTFGRIALFATALEIGALLLVYRKKSVAWLLSGALGLAALAVLHIYATFTGFGDTNSLLNPINQINTIVQRWAAMFQAFSNQPMALLIGFGNITARLDSTSSGAEQALSWVRMDTDLIRVTATTGVLGLVTWLGLFWNFFRQVRCAWRKHRPMLLKSPALGIAIGLAGALLTTLPGVTILTYTQVWPVVGICMGAAIGSLGETLVTSESKSR